VFGISFEELLVLAILAFILFGPQKLPEYAATLGRFVAKMRQATSDLSREYQNPFTSPPPATTAPPEKPALAEEGPFCPYCRAKVADDFLFCPRCGHRLKESHYPETPQQPLAS
jgi:Sec-independent protein translocase protein TatA